MTDKNSKKNFKAKVIAKLFGEADEDTYDQDDVTSGNSTEEDITAATSSAALVDSEIQDGPLYGVHCPLSDQRQKCFLSKITVNGASESDSTDEESENVRSRKRRWRRKGHHNSDKTDQEVKPSACDTAQTMQSVSSTTDSLLLTSVSLTKNQKRKLKKKRKEKEKRAQSTPSIEFIFDSSEKTCS